MKPSRHLLILLTMGVCFYATSPVLSAEEPTAMSSKTYTYKKVGDLELQLDVHRPDDDVMRPVAIWIHGGALIMGNRQSMLPPVTVPLLQQGYAIVSIDYRLAPETKLPDIIQDIEDAYDFVHTKGPELFHVKTDKIAVLGNSAGGYLTLTAGFRAQPRPAVLVAFYGYGDLVGGWYSAPSEFYRTTVPLITESQAREVVGTKPIADANLGSPKRGGFYLYTRQNGLWPKEVSGFDPHSEVEKFNEFMPVVNVTKDYPPTMLIHGDNDTDVPYEQSVMMAEELGQHGVVHEFITIKDGGHGFGGGDQKAIKKAYEDAVRFVLRNMK